MTNSGAELVVGGGGSASVKENYDRLVVGPGSESAGFWEINMKRIGMVLAVTLAFSLAGNGRPVASPGEVNGVRLQSAEMDGEWLSVGQAYSEQRSSPLKMIDTGNVGQLSLAWSYQFDTDRGQEATPVEIDGTLYTSTAWSKVFAFDATTGALKWSYDPKVDGAKGFDACCDVVNRGVAVWKGRVFVGALDGRLIALDAKTGGVAWSVQTTDTSRPYSITGAPRVVKDKVLIGNSGAEYGVRGYVSAYNAANGRLVWRFYTTPNPEGKPDGAASDAVLASKAAPTWFDGEWKRSGGGGTVWDGMAYDPELDIAYFGVGNGGPHNYLLRSGGKGDNLFLSSILALKPDTGEYVWHYQTTPGDAWDYTATQPLMLANLNLDGKPRKVLMQAPKNGFFYVIDRATGKLISAKPIVPINWATSVDMATGRPIENPKARYYRASAGEPPFLQSPGPAGVHNWHPMAYNAETGLVYIPAQVGWFAFIPEAKFTYRPGAWNMGLDYPAGMAASGNRSLMPREIGMPANQLVAWDPVTQTARWRLTQPLGPSAGVLTTAGRLVFQGSDDGDLSAYDAADGHKLWSTPTGNGVIAAPMTYAINGQQYVAVLVGAGGGGQMVSVGRQKVRLPGRLLVFKLGGTARLPKLDIPEPAAPLDLNGVVSGGDSARGRALFQVNCYMCHGLAASGPWVANIKHSPMLLTEDAWRSVVIDGALSSRGMASLSRYLSPRDAEDVRAYVLSLERAEAARGKVP